MCSPPPPPTPLVPFDLIGLVPEDDLDGFSWGPGPRDGETYALLFFVNRVGFMGAPPDANLAALGYEYNAAQQAGLNQAATDMFMSTALFDNSGQVDKGRAVQNNVLVRDGGDAGGADFSLIPGDPITVDDPNPGPQDNINGGSNQSGGKGRGLDVVYFTMQRQSPSLPDLPGIASPADIYYIDLDTPGTVPELFASALDLGLNPMDNVAALTVIRGSDTVVGPFGPGDRVILALDENSPSLPSLGVTAADLVTIGFDLPPQVYARGSEYGLDANAQLSGLTFYPTDDIFASVLRHGIKNGPVIGDLDDDGDVDQSDLGILLAAYGQSAGGDIDGDGDTDQSDLGLLLSNYGFGT